MSWCSSQRRDVVCGGRVVVGVKYIHQGGGLRKSERMRENEREWEKEKEVKIKKEEEEKGSRDGRGKVKRKRIFFVRDLRGECREVLDSSLSLNRTRKLARSESQKAEFVEMKSRQLVLCDPVLRFEDEKLLSRISRVLLYRLNFCLPPE